MFPYLFAAYVLFVALFQLGLILRWTRQLHSRHSTRYSFSEIFFLFFGPQFQANFEPQFWSDLVTRQNRSVLFGLAWGGLGFLFFLASIVVQGLMR